MKSVNLITVSGDFKFISELADPEIKFSSISGDADIVFSKDPDANFLFESTSGKPRAKLLII